MSWRESFIIEEMGLLAFLFYQFDSYLQFLIYQFVSFSSCFSFLYCLRFCSTNLTPAHRWLLRPQRQRTSLRHEKAKRRNTKTTKKRNPRESGSCQEAPLATVSQYHNLRASVLFIKLAAVLLLLLSSSSSSSSPPPPPPPPLVIVIESAFRSDKARLTPFARNKCLRPVMLGRKDCHASIKLALHP